MTSDPRPESSLERRLAAGDFCITAEVVPPRSADAEAVTRQAHHLVGWVDAANVTDNPTSRVHMSAVAGAALVARAGVEPVLQMTVRDRNRMALSSDRSRPGRSARGTCSACPAIPTDRISAPCCSIPSIRRRKCRSA